MRSMTDEGDAQSRRLAARPSSARRAGTLSRKEAGERYRAQRSIVRRCPCRSAARKNRPPC